MNQWEKDAWKFIEQKTYMNNERIGANFPHSVKNKHYTLESPQWWTAGFWPGILWRVYLKSKNESLRITAENCEEKMDYLLNDVELVDHDLGFMWTLTSVANYKITGNSKSRKRALLAANLLMARFNVKGNFIRAWNPWNKDDDNRGVVIMDSMMNLPILYWASEETGDPRFRNLAEEHANTILRNFVREDGSIYHTVIFDSETGEVVEKTGGQGFDVNSAWSRGCAWAIYGFTLSYKYTKNLEMLNAAKKVAHYFIANMQGKKYPLWDFRLPKDGDVKYQYSDSSAGAIAACGLLLLSKYVTTFEAELYADEGENMLKNLYLECATTGDLEEEGLLKHGTGHFPQQKNLDVPLIYGDYFFTEGISILNCEKMLFW